MQQRGTYRQGAAICRRGHVETYYLNPSRPARAIAENCPTCGARVLTACPHCDLRIRGDLHVPGVIGFSPDTRPSFCDGCGSAFPWATREERIYELENLLDEEDMTTLGELPRLCSSKFPTRRHRQRSGCRVPAVMVRRSCWAWAWWSRSR